MLDTFTTHFEQAIPFLREQIMLGFQATESQAGYRTVWEEFEKIINPVLIKFLTGEPLKIPAGQISEARSKSVYPDLEIFYQGKKYAIDVKSGEDGRNPWYDIGRLDTYEDSHLKKYSGEYCITVRWVGRPIAKVIDVYIEPTFKSVGFRSDSGGVLYRPYDGKLRPKSWSDFENNKFYWSDPAHFLAGLHASKIYRQRAYIIACYMAMSLDQRLALKQDISKVDAGQIVSLELDRDVEPGEGNS